MRLAEEEITVTIEGERIFLRPTLRAAFRLERRYEGFPAILRRLEEGSLVVIADMVAECSENRTNLPALLAPGLAWRLDVLVPSFQALTLALMGFDADAEDTNEDPAANPRVTFAEAHARLYQIATGWLGWTPADAWNATPMEIRTAYEGRLDLLQAVGLLSLAKAPAEKAVSLDDKFAALIARNATLPGATARQDYDGTPQAVLAEIAKARA